MPLGRWKGPFDTQLADRRVLRVGDEMEVSDRQLESAHWEPVDSPATPKATPTFKTSEGGDD